MSYLLLALLAWFLYNLIFRLIVPAYRATKTVRKQFTEMQEKMQQKARGQEPQPSTAGNKTSNPKPSSSDYIDFEEIK